VLIRAEAISYSNRMDRASKIWRSFRQPRKLNESHRAPSHRLGRNRKRGRPTRLDDLFFYCFIDKWRNSTLYLGDLRGLQFIPTVVRHGREHVMVRRVELDPPSFGKTLQFFLRVYGEAS